MKVLMEGYKYITVSSTRRLSQLFTYYSKISTILDNTWFNKGKKDRLRRHLDKVNSHQNWLIKREYKCVVASGEVNRVFIKPQGFTIDLLIKEL